jgi:2-oxoglutarate ferredoxin oxidoreductase subunit beta
MSAQLQAKDFASSQEVRWCPGCGDYAVLKSVTRALADVGAVPENTVFVSGIGCASRFPYYVETYGFHTIHGRAPAVATGLKLANPNLDVWVVTGDGDGLSIGSNHLMHALRRNVGFKILLFNNEVYGLTKGQYSPTSRLGTRTPSSPYGSFDAPISAGGFALGSGARFIARAVDVDKTGLGNVLEAAHGFEGAAFVEIFQNCIVYNDGVYNAFTDRDKAAEAQIHVEHGKPLVFGENGAKGLKLDVQSLSLENIDAQAHPDEVLVHDETNRIIAQLLLGMAPPEFPVALGVIHRRSGQPSFEKAYYANHPTQLKRTARVADALRQTSTWTVPAPAPVPGK